MRMMLKVSIPVLTGNKALKEGLLPKTVMGFVEQFKPEASFFTAEGGERTAYFYFDMKDPAQIPAIAEPFFQNLDAAIEFKPVMNIEEMRTGVDKALKR